MIPLCFLFPLPLRSRIIQLLSSTLSYTIHSCVFEVCAYTRGTQRLALVCLSFLDHFSLSLYEIGLLTESQAWYWSKLGWPEKPPSLPTPAAFHTAGVTHLRHHVQLLHGLWGTRTQVTVLTWLAFHWANFLTPSNCFSFLISWFIYFIFILMSECLHTCLSIKCMLCAQRD